jgi:aminoglycoside phosphotransferase (APT) family kinase protein
MSSNAGAPGAVAKLARQAAPGFQRDLERWITAHVEDCATCRIVSLSVPASGGLTGETVIVGLEGAPWTSLVVKKDVRERVTNPQSSFATQARMHRILGGRSGLKVPRLLGAEYDERILGAPFLVLEFVAGSIPSDVPSYAAAGWLCEATADQRRRLWASGIDFLVRLHSWEWEPHGLGDLQFDAAGANPLERCLNYAVRMFRQEARGRTSPVCEQAIDWLRLRRPALQRQCLNWGDARIGNMIWRDFECAAVIDWEMATIGYPGMDLGWWSFFHRWSTYGQGYPELEGMCVGQALADLYAARGGGAIESFVYYEVLAAIRGLSIWLRTYDAMRAQGALPEMNPLGDAVHMVRVLEAMLAEAD